jgi:MoxR-like ATPase
MDGSEFVENEDEYLDTRGLKIAFEEFKDLKGDDFPESYKSDIFRELNAELGDKEISASNIEGIVEFLKESNPDEGNFCEWSELSALESFVEENPEHGSEVLSYLIRSDDDIGDRISEFKGAVNEGVDKHRIDGSGTAYVLAAFNSDKFVPYRATVYSRFIEWFSNRFNAEDSVNNKLAHYINLCESVKSFFDFNSVLEAQDFMYSVTRYDELEDRVPLLYLWKFSQDWKSFSSDTEELLDAIKRLPDDYLERREDDYSDSDRIREIRFEMLQRINSDSETVSLADLEDIKQDVNSKYDKNITQAYSNFSILGQIYLDFFGNMKSRGNKGIWHYITDDLVNNLDYSISDPHIVDFSGARGQMTTTPWIALYPNSFDSQSRSPQFFLQIKEDEIDYGLYRGDEFSGDLKPDIESFMNKNEVSLELVIKKFEEVRNKVSDLSNLQDSGVKQLASVNYFWVTANPSIWDVSELSEDDQKFYPAYLPSGNKARIFSNFEKASEGDKVVFYQSTPVKKVVAEGIVREGLHKEEVEGYDNAVEGITLKYKREIEGDVSWSKLKEIPDLEDSKPIINTAQGSIFKLEQEEFETILSLENPEPTEEKLAEFTQTPEFNIKVPEDLYFENESDLRNEISASLNSGKNIIFTGPPGTGKTKLAKSISEQVSENNDIVEGSVFTTATADWTAFDTIGGYMPSQGNGDELEFNPGQFLKCFREESGEVTNKWLVIDEINRSDIDKAFGQLFSVLSGDSVELPYKKDGHVKLEKVDEDDNTEEIESNEDVYPVTDSWRLIATMNTYDKTSLYDMSYAFMRRFNFIHIGVPDLKTEEKYNFSLLDPEIDENYASVWEAEKVLEKDDFYKDLTVLWHEVNRQRDIGPSIIKDIIDFVDAHPGDKKTALAQAVNSLILPQFEGLRREKQENFVNALNGENSIDIKSELVEEKAENMFNLDLSE